MTMVLPTKIDPLHVVEGAGDILGCVRDGRAPTRKKRSGILQSGPGDSTYLQYDVRSADNGCAWLRAHNHDDKPWAVFLSFVCPHPPYICPRKYFDRYITQVRTPVALVDVFPTAIECVGGSLADRDLDLPGEDLWSIANEPDRDRTVFSEYHAVGSRHGSYMLRDLTHKYIHYAHEPVQLFDMRGDPDELVDLSTSEPARVADFERRLLKSAIPSSRIGEPKPTRQPRSSHTAALMRYCVAAPSTTRQCPGRTPRSEPSAAHYRAKENAHSVPDSISTRPISSRDTSTEGNSLESRQLTGLARSSQAKPSQSSKP